jgi:hypothetical protein
VTLDQLVAWAKTHGVPGDKHLSFGVPLCTPAAVRYDLAHGVFVLMPVHEVNSKIRNVCIDCLCPPSVAERYLDQSNWNVPLAVTTYQRENRGKESEAGQRCLESGQGSDGGSDQG